MQNKSAIVLLLPLLIFSLSTLIATAQTPQQSPKQESAENSSDFKNDKQAFDKFVIDAFVSTCEGWSSDEVILRDELNANFLKACREQLPNVSAAKLNWRLMNLRKAGKLSIKSTKRSNVSCADCIHIAEIAARTTQDRQKVSIDQIMATPEMKSQFDEVARSVDPDVDLYKVRKAAFQLRKARKLRPELITRIADWGRTISANSADAILATPDLIKPHPGIYIFRDKTGYLYIGQTDNLQERLKSHLDESHNLSLAKYLGSQKLKGISIEIHSFHPDSRAKETMIRRAYESELIASRKPRFNIQP